jgi:hypothetical protein
VVAPSRLQSAVYLQPEKQVTGPSVRQTPVRQALSVSCAQDLPAPPTAVEAAGVYWQIATMLEAGLSAGRYEGEQKSDVPLPAPLIGAPQSGPAKAVSVTHLCPHFDAGPQ